MPTTPISVVNTAPLRFKFGENWSHFIPLLDEARIHDAKKSLINMLEMQDLEGKRFLDVGSGSGLFSLAARMLGASVQSFDFDDESVVCTKTVQEQYFPNDQAWNVQQGDVLDLEFLNSFDSVDIVYSWGVLHHTGALWRALENIVSLVNVQGHVFIAIYNDQGMVSRYWLQVKNIYNANWLGEMLMILVHAPYLYYLRRFVRIVQRRGPLPRGMDLWRDMLDWLGGLPFEVAKPNEVIRVFDAHGFRLVKIKTCGRRHGCNEFVFYRDKL